MARRQRRMLVAHPWCNGPLRAFAFTAAPWQLLRVHPDVLRMGGHGRRGGYAAALMVCLVLKLGSAAIMLLRPRRVP